MIIQEEERMILEEHRYKWQNTCKSYSKHKTIDELIDWWKRFNNYTLEDYVEIDEIVEIRITVKNTPYCIWFQLIRNDLNTFDITLIINDYPCAKLKSKDFELFLKVFLKGVNQ